MIHNEELVNICKSIRGNIAKYGYTSGRGHISSALSLVEILTSLYIGGVMQYNSNEPEWQERDRLILSKGHAGLALYLVLQEVGIISEKDLEGFCTINGRLSTHPVLHSIPGIEMSAGSLGHGLSYGAGVALAGKLNGYNYHTYIIIGDGESQEGSIWESALFASQHNLDNLTVIVDRNGLQITDCVDNIVSLSPLLEKWSSFGFDVKEVNGHDIGEILCALSNKDSNGHPKAIIANTVKGKGLLFIEGKNGWHGKGLSDSEWQQAKVELNILE